MKKILLLIAVALTIVGCSKSEDIPQPSEPETGSAKEYIVSLAFTGEMTITEQPMTKSASANNDLYGIQIYSKPKGSDFYQSYAYGVFDDPTQMAVKLLDGYAYKFECSIVIDGKNKVRSEDNVYAHPFSGNSGFGHKLDNTFHFLSNNGLQVLSYGNTCMKDAKEYKYSRPNTDRYYGITENYQPSDDNTKISIYMKRTVYEAKFVAIGLTEGRLKIQMDDAPALYINASDDSQEIKDIFTFYWLTRAYEKDDYIEDVKTTVIWEKENGTIVPIISSKVINFKRKTTTTSTIDLNLISESNRNMEITKEDPTIVDGDKITLL